MKMSLDKSLKTGGTLSKHRNVLRRAERITKLQDEGHWLEDQSPLGLPKVAHRKAKVGGKAKKKAEATAETTAEGASETSETEKK